MKLIEIPKAKDFTEEDASAYVEGYGDGAQTQLKADQKKVQEMFDEIQELFFTFDGDGELILRSEMNGNRKVDEWQKLKEGVK